jgi:hypothetical protein
MSTWTEPEGKFDSPERQRVYLADAVKPSTVIYTRLSPGAGETDYIEVFIAPRKGAIRNMTWQVAKACGLRVKDRQGKWFIPMGGGGYSKGLQVYLDIRYTLGHQSAGDVSGQSKWEQL